MDLDYFLDQYYQATHIPVSFFQDRALVSKSSLSLQDFNLPLILLNGLSDPLPELWYSYTSEYLYFGGFTVEEENGILFVGPVLPSECLPRQAETILRRLGRSAKDSASLRAYFAGNISCDLSALLAHLRFLQYAFNRKKEADIARLPFTWNIPYPVLEDIPIELRQSIDPADSW